MKSDPHFESLRQEATDLRDLSLIASKPRIFINHNVGKLTANVLLYEQHIDSSVFLATEALIDFGI